MTQDLKQVVDYHERTKHNPGLYAQGPEHLDWATQPDPFRSFAGCPRSDLPLGADRLATAFADLYHPSSVTGQPLNRESVAVLFELSLGLSAWKQYQTSRWALRCNPSSGNLHPTEGYAIVPDITDLPAGVYHYVSRDHALEHRCTANRAVGLAPRAFLIGLSSVHWRESWKYGERAFRYCQHDMGHAIAAVRYAAAALGWSALLLDHVGDAALTTLLGLDDAASFANVDPADREHPGVLLLVRTNSEEALLPQIVPLDQLANVRWSGRANSLSPAHVKWPLIDRVAAATLKPATSPPPPVRTDALPELHHTSTASVATLIRQRRSCLALDGTTAISAETFYAILDRSLPRPSIPPWDALPWDPHIHAAIFVHRVEGLPPGLYAFERSPAVHDRLRSATHQGFVWEAVRGCPGHLRLFLLAEGDCRGFARAVSCEQEIGSDGAFSLGMIADFGESIREIGPWWYRRLFWEAGVLGQVLYLEAEAAGVRGTGIGCYFDDIVHDRLGLRGDEFQDLYHFTIGGPVDDGRLTTLSPYAHLKRP